MFCFLHDSTNCLIGVTKEGRATQINTIIDEMIGSTKEAPIKHKEVFGGRKNFNFFFVC